MSDSVASRWVKIATTDMVDADDMIGVEFEGRQIALYHHGGRFFATANICTHAYALLTDGFFDDGIIECPLHAGRFEIASGRALGLPLTRDLKTYPVRVEAGDILIGLD